MNKKELVNKEQISISSSLFQLSLSLSVVLTNALWGAVHGRIFVSCDVSFKDYRCLLGWSRFEKRWLSYRRGNQRLFLQAIWSSASKCRATHVRGGARGWGCWSQTRVEVAIKFCLELWNLWNRLLLLLLSTSRRVSSQRLITCRKRTGPIKWWVDHSTTTSNTCAV